MSSTHQNLSDYNIYELPDASAMRIAIVVAEWNKQITEALYEGALNALTAAKIQEKNIKRINVPGSFELPMAAQCIYLQHKVDAVICLGCVIQGETRHFDFICNSVSQGLMELSLKHNIPFIFGVLTPNDEQQAMDRAGGKHGNKGVEAAVTAIKMIALQKALKK